MKEITMKIRIDDRKGAVELRRAGCKLPEFWVGSKSPEAVAEAWRCLAAYAMEQAFEVEHSRDFCAPDFTDTEREQMAMRICEENRNFFMG